MGAKGVRTLERSASHKQLGKPISTHSLANPGSISRPKTAPIPYRNPYADSSVSSWPTRDRTVDGLVKDQSAGKISEPQPKSSRSLSKNTSPTSIQLTPPSMQACLDTTPSAGDRVTAVPKRGRKSQPAHQGRVHGSQDPTPEAPEERSHSQGYWPPTDTRRAVNGDKIPSSSLLDELRAGSEVEDCRQAHLNDVFDITHLPRERNPFVTPPYSHTRKDDSKKPSRLQGRYTELVMPTKDCAGRAKIPVEISFVPASAVNGTLRPSPNPSRATTDSAIALSDKDANKHSPRVLQARDVASRRSLVEYEGSSSTKERDIVPSRQESAHGVSNFSWKYVLASSHT